MRLAALTMVFSAIACAQPLSPRCDPRFFETPSYPRLVLLARISGVVNARILIGPDGSAKSAAYSGHALLVPAIQAAIDGSRLSGACAGREYRLTYKLVIENRFTAPPRQTSKFESPNEFVITSTQPLPENDAAASEPCSPTNLDPPHYPWLALTARVAGAVKVRFVLDSNGRLKNPVYVGHPLLVFGVKKFLESSQLATFCAGRDYQLTYRFEIRGKAGFPVKESVSFHPPDEFVVRSNQPGLMVEQSDVALK